VSVIAAFLGEDGVAFAADGAASDRDGILMFETHKLWALPSGDGYFAQTGIGSMGDRMLERLEVLAPADFDAAVELIAEVARSSYEEAISEWPREHLGDPPGGTIVIGGWSAKLDAPRLFRFGCKPRDAINAQTGEAMILPPFELTPLAGVWASHSPSPESEAAFDLGGEHPALDLLARIVAAGRADSAMGAALGGDGGFAAGCFLEMAIVTRSFRRQWVAHRWEEDRIGWPIVSDDGDSMPTYPISIPA
jgi:hypothetical protein